MDARRRPSRQRHPGVSSTALLGGIAAVTAHYVPATIALGQWTAARALPRGLCRWRGPVSPHVALTFDDGPDPASTPRVLDRLDELGLHATFFCLGTQVERHTALVDEIGRRGHQIETHGYRHRHHLACSPRWIVDDLRRATSIMAACGHPASWYRPSYGQATGTTLAAARALGLSVVLWSAWGREWVDDDPTSVSRRIAPRLEPGAIVLLHDSDAAGVPGMSRVACAALGSIAAELDRRGLASTRLDRLVDGGDAPAARRLRSSCGTGADR